MHQWKKYQEQVLFMMFSGVRHCCFLLVYDRLYFIHITHILVAIVEMLTLQFFRCPNYGNVHVKCSISILYNKLSIW